MLAVPILSLVMSPVQAAGILLPIYVISDVFGLIAYRRHWDRRVLATLLPGSIAGIALGWATASLVDDAAVVREPISWLGSWYRYRQRPQTMGKPNSTIGISFEGFVQDYLSENRPSYAALGRQSGFLSPAPGRNGPDLLFQYERMDEVLAFFGEALKTELTLKRVNVSPPADMSLAPETEARLRAALAEDYALWESAARSAP